MLRRGSDVARSWAVVEPVNFALLGEDVVRTGAGTKLAAAVSRGAVSFEVDSVDEATGSGGVSS